MNKTGQTNITIIFWIIMAVIVWAIFASTLIAEWGHQIVVTAGYTGFPALFYNNLNLLIGFVFLISILGIAIYGGTT